MATAAVQNPMPAPTGPVQTPTHVAPPRAAKEKDSEGTTKKRKNAKHLLTANALEAQQDNGPEMTYSKPAENANIPFENGFAPGAEDDDDSDTQSESDDDMDDEQATRLKSGADDVLKILTDTAYMAAFPAEVAALTNEIRPVLFKAWTKDDNKGKFQAKFNEINSRIRKISPLEKVKVMKADGKEVEEELPVWRIHEFDGPTILQRIKLIRNEAAGYETARLAGNQLDMTRHCQTGAMNALGLASVIYKSGVNFRDILTPVFKVGVVQFMLEAMESFSPEAKIAAQALLTREFGQQVQARQAEHQIAPVVPTLARPHLASPQPVAVPTPVPVAVPTPVPVAVPTPVPVNSEPVSVHVVPHVAPIARSGQLRTGGRRGPIFGTLRTSVGIISAVQKMGDRASRFIVNIATEGAPVYRIFPGSDFGRGVAVHYLKDESLAIRPMKMIEKRKAQHVLSINGFVEVERSPDALYKREPVTRFFVQWDNSDPQFEGCPEKEWVTRTELLSVCGKVYVAEVRQGLRSEMLDNYEYLKQAKAANINPETNIPLTESEKSSHPWLFCNLSTGGHTQTVVKARDAPINEVEPDVSHIRVGGTKLGAMKPS